MAERPETPLTDFLIELVHDLRKLALFTGTEEERDDLLRQYPGLTPDHLEALRSGDLGTIQQAVAAEHGSADAPAVAYWVTFPLKRPIN